MLRWCNGSHAGLRSQCPKSVSVRVWPGAPYINTLNWTQDRRRLTVGWSLQVNWRLRVFIYGFRLLLSWKWRVVHEKIQVAMAPLARQLRRHSSVNTTRQSPLVFGQGNNSSLGATVEKRGPSKILAPFVYRLGHPPFTQVRGVRFSYGVPYKYEYEGFA